MKPENWTPPTPAEVRAALDYAGISARHAARTIGVSHTTIDRWLKGELTPRYPYWRLLTLELELADALERTPQEAT